MYTRPFSYIRYKSFLILILIKDNKKKTISYKIINIPNISNTEKFKTHQCKLIFLIIQRAVLEMNHSRRKEKVSVYYVNIITPQYLNINILQEQLF